MIAIPNFKSFDSKYYGKYWAGYDTPRHLWHFSRKGIGLMAKKNNLKILKVKSLHLDSIYVSYLSEKYKRSPFPLLIGIVIGCISILKSKPKIKRSMWSRRAQEYEAKISSGKIYDLAEVVRDLNKGDDLMVDQSYSERQLFEKAYERIMSEFQIILNLSLEDTQKKLDKALKRNLNTQPKPEAAPIKQASSDLPEEEAVSENEEDIEE